MILNFYNYHAKNKVFLHFQWHHFSLPFLCENQGRTKQRNCRLSTETPDCQLGWAFWASSWLLDTLKYATFILCSKNCPKLACYITSRLHNINSQSTIPSLRSSLVKTIGYLVPAFFMHITLYGVCCKCCLWLNVTFVFYYYRVSPYNSTKTTMIMTILSTGNLRQSKNEG